MEKLIRINLVLPFKARRPVGGLRVMYGYANRLSELGYSVHLTYPIQTKFIQYRLPCFVRSILYRLEGFRTYEWFPFHKKVTRSIVQKISNKNIQDADIIISTWWSTAIEVGELNESKGKKINLIQGYEDWEGHTDLLHSSYNITNTTDVVVASYLENIVKSYTNNRVVLIPNAIDTKSFFLKNSIKDRSQNKICMIYSTQKLKGSDYGLKALIKAKEKCSDLEVELFGICPELTDLPEWIKFHRDPKDLNDLYNRNAIFIANSFNEGMSLTPMEAMFAGCACILTDIRGHSEYSIDEETTLLYEAGNIDQLSGKIVELIENKEKRIKIAEISNAFIQKFSWDNTVLKMDNLIKELLQS